MSVFPRTAWAKVITFTLHPLSVVHDHLIQFELNILDPEADTLLDPKPASVKKLFHQDMSFRT